MHDELERSLEFQHGGFILPTVYYNPCIVVGQRVIEYRGVL